jgi:hypothetical protein
VIINQEIVCDMATKLKSIKIQSNDSMDFYLMTGIIYLFSLCFFFNFQFKFIKCCDAQSLFGDVTGKKINAYSQLRLEAQRASRKPNKLEVTVEHQLPIFPGLISVIDQQTHQGFKMLPIEPHSNQA